MEGLLIMLPFAVLMAVIVIVAVIYERKRSARLQEIAGELGLEFYHESEAPVVTAVRSLRLFQMGRRRRVRNVMAGQRDGLELAIFGYRYVTGGGKNSSTHSQTVFALRSSELVMPDFEIRPEHVFHKIGQAMGYQDIDFPEHPEFSRRFVLRGADEAAIRRFFRPDFMSFLLRLKNVSVEASGDRFIMYRSRRRISPDDIREFLDNGIRLYGQMRGA